MSNDTVKYISKIYFSDIYFTKTNNCGTLRDLAPFAQFKKRAKHP